MNAVMEIEKRATGNVAPEYVHYDKLIEPGENIDLGTAYLKWYDLAPPDEFVPAKIHELARTFLKDEASSGRLDDLGELGFVILHRCGESFYFLLVNTWKNENELWETVYAKRSDEHENFEDFSSTGSHRATFCVWELAAVWHEQQAWRRRLLSGSEVDSERIYLQDRYSGPA